MPITTAIGIAGDMQSGAIDRFRSLPMARAAVLIGHATADFLRGAAVVALVVGIGFALGFDIGTNWLAFLAGVGLVLAFSYALIWASAFVEVVTGNAQSAEGMIFTALFPLTFASSAFAPTESMPCWLQVFTAHQPFSVVVYATRVQGERCRNRRCRPHRRRALFEHVREQRDLLRALLGRRGGTVVHTRIRQVLIDLVRDELEPRTGTNAVVPIDIAVDSVVGAYLALLSRWVDDNEPRPPSEMDLAFRRLIIPDVVASLDLINPAMGPATGTGQSKRATRHTSEIRTSTETTFEW